MGGFNDGGRYVDMGGCNVDPPRRCNVGDAMSSSRVSVRVQS
jgi:hypothetical protein